MKSASEDPDDEADLSASWKALWDEENIYFYIAVTDDETVTDDNWQDDSIEIYILPDGVTGEVDYSTDLINWATIATGVTGPYSDADAARAGTPAGFYRAKQ